MGSVRLSSIHRVTDSWDDDDDLVDASCCDPDEKGSKIKW